MSDYLEIPEVSADAGSPIDEDLMRGTSGADPDGGMRGNFKNLDERVTSVEGAGGGGGSGIAAEERFCVIEKRLSIPKSLDPTEGICESFLQPARIIEGRLLRAYTASDAKIHYAINPKFLESGNEDSLFTGFVYITFSNTSGIAADSTNNSIGADGIGFNKVAGGVLSMVQRDITAAAAISVIGNQTLRCSVHLPVVSTVASVNIRLADETETTVGGTVWSQFDVTLQSDGSALVIGLNTLEFDLSSTSSTGATPWDVTKLVRVMGLGVTTNGASDLLTGIVFDSLMFEENDNQAGLVPGNERLLQKTIEVDLVDATNDNQFVIDTASNDVSGIVTPASTFATTFAGGSVSRIFRSTLKTTNGFAEFNDDSLIASGSTANKNTFRNRKALPGGSASNATVSMSVARRHELTFDIINGTLSGTTLSINDPADRSTELPSGATIRRYKKVWSEGNTDYQENGLLTLTGASTHSAGVTTLTVASTAGIGNDEAVAREGDGTNDDVEAFVIMHSVTTNTAYGAAKTPNERIARLQPIYPGIDKVIAHWRLGGPNTFAGTKQLIVGTSVGDLSITGAPTQGEEFVNRTIQGAGNFSAANAFQIPAADSGIFNPNFTVAGGDAITISMWVRRQSSILQHFMERHNGATLGFYGGINASDQVFVVANNVTNTNTGFALALDTWTHVMITMKDKTAAASDVDIKIWADGVRADFTLQNINDVSLDFDIGHFGASTAWAGEISDVIVWKGFDPDDSSVALIRSGGFWVDLASGLILIDRYETTGLTGEVIDSKIITRRATGLTPTYSHFVTAKTN